MIESQLASKELPIKKRQGYERQLWLNNGLQLKLSKEVLMNYFKIYEKLDLVPQGYFYHGLVPNRIF